MIKSRLESALVAVAFGVFAGLVLPLQTYLANASDYETVTGVRLAVEQAAVALVLSALVFALLRLSDRFLGGWLTPVFTGLLVCVYLETGPLSFGLPELDGDIAPELGEDVRKVWDAVVWIGILGVAAALFRWARGGFGWVAAGLAVLGCASLLDVRGAKPSVDEDGPADAATTEQIVSALEYSPTRNVILIVLDSVPASAADDVIGRCPDLATRFPGFTAFRNNVGMAHCTSRAVPGMMTGRYYGDDGANRDEYQMSAAGPDSFLEVYKDCGYSVFCTFDFLTYGYTTAEIAPTARAETAGRRPAVLVPSREIPYLTIADVLLFRAVPFAVKSRLLFRQLHRNKKNRDSANESFSTEHVLFPRLAAKDVSSDPRPMFCKFHTQGVHMPVLFDADGKAMTKTQKDPDMLECAVSNVLVGVARLMDAYRERGLYDKSFIVIAADHGSPLASSAEGVHPKASAMMWIKPEGATGPLRISDAPTTHAKFHELMRAVARGPVPADRIAAFLEADVRQFRFREKGEDVNQRFDREGRPLAK